MPTVRRFAVLAVASIAASAGAAPVRDKVMPKVRPLDRRFAVYWDVFTPAQ